MSSVIDSMTEGDAPTGNSKSFLDHTGLISTICDEFHNLSRNFRLHLPRKPIQTRVGHGTGLYRDYTGTCVPRSTMSGQFHDNFSRSHRCVSHREPSPEP